MNIKTVSWSTTDGVTTVYDIEDHKNDIKDASAHDTDIDKYSADIDEAFDVVGIGWYNLKYCFIVSLLLIASLMDLVGASLILPAAVCDLQMTDTQRGLIMSIPYTGILLTSYPWGYLVDTRGRKKMLIYSSFAAGILNLSCGLMPDLTTFAICKCLASLCIACPSAAPYTFIGEMLPLKYRVLFLSVLNSTQLTGSAIVPLLAWAILPLDFRVAFGIYVFRPWRLITIVLAMFYIVSAALLTCSPESPKFLASQNKRDEALRILQNMYAGNKGKRPEEYPIKQILAPPHQRGPLHSISSWMVISAPLLNWSQKKKILLNGALLFGIYVITSGLNMWTPDVLNRVLTGSGVDKTACQVIHDMLNQTSSDDAECDDTIDEMVFIINIISRLCCAVVALVASYLVKYIGKKKLIITTFLYIGLVCITVNLITNDTLFSILLSSTPMVVLAIGPINAYAVEMFPTHLRGMAVSLTMMLGRTGSVVGANVTGLMINNACEIMFYTIGGLLFFCGALALLLPNSRVTSQERQAIEHHSAST